MARRARGELALNRTAPAGSKLLLKTKLLFALETVAVVLLPRNTGLARSGIPRPDHVVIVVEENRAYRQIIGSPSAPYINALAQRGALFTESYGIRHPSQPNYLALFSGSTQGLTDDSCPHAFGGANLGRALLDAGWSFAGYSESMPTNGFTGCNSGSYARKHSPWVNFTNLPAQVNRTFAEFPTNFDALPTVAFVIPNLDNDMHDGSVARGDAWLQTHLDRYVQWAQTHNSLLILTWDEDDRSENNHIATIFVGPMVQPGRYRGRINHYTLLRTLEDMFDLPHANQSTNTAPILNVWTSGLAGPSVRLTAPLQAEVQLQPATWTLAATAVGNGRRIEKVEFFAGVTRLGEDNTPPYTWVWANVPAGVYSLNVRATDERGAVSCSTPVEVTVLSVTQLMARARGVFDGLFFQTNGVDSGSAGEVSLVATTTGNFSARLRLGGGRYAWRGQFDQNGRAGTTLARSGTNALRVELALDLLHDPDVLRGTVSDGHWIAELVAKRAVFDVRTNPAPQSGPYTLLLPIRGESGGIPGGVGFGRVRVDAGGRVQFNGSLADGSKLTQSSALSGDGEWPFFVPLYRGGGLALGWLTFTNLPADDLSGAMVWIRPPQPGARWFPDGFAVETTARGSRLQWGGSSQAILSFTNGLVIFEGGNLPRPFTNRIAVAANAISNLESNRLTLSLAGSSGLFSGRATDPTGARTFRFDGAVHQKRDLGAGFFLGTNRSGSVWLQPAR